MLFPFPVPSSRFVSFNQHWDVDLKGCYNQIMVTLPPYKGNPDEKEYDSEQAVDVSPSGTIDDGSKSKKLKRGAVSWVPHLMLRCSSKS